MNKPDCILLISGKRKSGKDFIAESLKSIFQQSSCIVRISEPIKRHYAQQNNLELTELMSESPYKEKHRLTMIIWSEQVRAENPGYFCEAACKNAAIVPIWIVSDVRRNTDVEWFKNVYGDRVKTVRITADDDVRIQRGWRFCSGVDDAASECDLDNYDEWHLQITNNNEADAKSAVASIKSLIPSNLITSAL